MERALETHPAIERAAAYGVPDALLGETVEAAATPARDGAEIGERDLVAHCASILAPFKEPRRIVILADMPTTATGKIRRHALRAVVRGRIDVRGGVDAVESSTERERDPRFASLDRPSVVALVRAELASLVPALATIDDDAPLAHAGLHSVAAVELSRRLNVALADATSETLPSLLVFDRPTVRAIADYVARDERGVLNLDGTHHRRVAPFAASYSFSAAARLSGRSAALGGFAFGGSSDDLVLAVETQTATPRDRWDLEATGGLLVASDRDRADPSEMASIVTRHASYLAEDAFACDPEIVGAGVAELAAMDPSHRLVVLHAAAASVDARLDAKLDAKLDGAFTSVYVGCMWGGEWSDHLATNAGVSDAPSAAASTGSGLSFMAGRVAFTLNLRGACAAIDTACSSSLVATHMARESLVSAGGAHDAAVAAGVSVSLRAETTTSIAALGALSPEGRCKTFDASADGYGRGEGCVAFFVETFDDRDGHDGDFPTRPRRRVPPTPSRSRSRRRRRTRMVDPRRSPRRMARSTGARARRDPRARERSWRRSRRSARRDRLRLPGRAPQRRSSDPIEVAALVAAFPSRPLRLAAPKSASGHAEGAAGTHSLLVAARTLERGVCPPIAHLRRISAHVVTASAGGGGLVAPRQPRPAMTRVIRSDDAFAGCSAFGMSGVNAHAVVERARFTRSRGGSGERRAEEPPDAIARASSRNTRGSSRRFARQQRGSRRAWMRFSGTRGDPRACRSSFRDGLAPRVRLQDTPLAGCVVSGPAGLCAFVAAARASLGTRTDVADVAVVDVIFARPVDADADVACEIFADGVASVGDGATRGKIIMVPSSSNRDVSARNRDESLAGAWNRDSGTTRESIASRVFPSTRHATRTSFPALVASKINPARRDEGRHPTDARGVAPNILDAALHSTAALDAAFPKRTSSLRIPRSVDAFYASSNDAACSSSTFARASRSASRVRTRRETDADHVVPRAAIVRGVALATVTNAKKASSDDSRGMSRREADGTTRPDPTAYVSVALATPSTRDDFVQSPRRICDFFASNREESFAATRLRSSILRARRRRRRPRRSPRFKISTRSTARPSF